LTAASTVVFAELHWTPGMMVQAEDRAHRIGQKSSVNCHYLLGENSLDDILYRNLEKKVHNVSSFVDGRSQKLEIEKVSKGEKGKFSSRTSE
jgi:SWI/SNF-related matrix-associated actin-dependent regulator of chromatin subfamily A-like protein 1